MHVPLAIVGAGPAGLAAALTAARRLPPRSVLVLDRLPSPAVKLARTGGGRGNLSHLAGENDFAAAFGHAGRFIVPAYRALTPTALRGERGQTPSNPLLVLYWRMKNTIFPIIEDGTRKQENFWKGMKPTISRTKKHVKRKPQV